MPTSGIPTAPGTRGPGNSLASAVSNGQSQKEYMAQWQAAMQAMFKNQANMIGTGAAGNAPFFPQGMGALCASPPPFPPANAAGWPGMDPSYMAAVAAMAGGVPGFPGLPTGGDVNAARGLQLNSGSPGNASPAGDGPASRGANGADSAGTDKDSTKSAPSVDGSSLSALTAASKQELDGSKEITGNGNGSGDASLRVKSRPFKPPHAPHAAKLDSKVAALMNATMFNHMHPAAAVPTVKVEAFKNDVDSNGQSDDIMDEKEVKKQRRKQSNRESARRSRLRKQAECEELSVRVNNLAGENSDLHNELQHMKERCAQLVVDNKRLQAQLNGFAEKRRQNDLPIGEAKEEHGATMNGA